MRAEQAAAASGRRRRAAAAMCCRSGSYRQRVGRMLGCRPLPCTPQQGSRSSQAPFRHMQLRLAACPSHLACREAKYRSGVASGGLGRQKTACMSMLWTAAARQALRGGGCRPATALVCRPECRAGRWGFGSSQLGATGKRSELQASPCPTRRSDPTPPTPPWPSAPCRRPWCATGTPGRLWSSITREHGPARAWLAAGAPMDVWRSRGRRQTQREHGLGAHPPPPAAAASPLRRHRRALA